MEDIRDKIIPIIEFEKLNIYFKTKDVDGLLGEFFYGVWYWYTLVKSKTIEKFKVFGWNSIQRMCFFAFV